MEEEDKFEKTIKLEEAELIAPAPAEQKKEPPETKPGEPAKPEPAKKKEEQGS